MLGSAILLLATISIGLVLAEDSEQANQPAVELTQPSLLSRFGLKLPKIFTFDYFKQLYNKHYASPTEEASRSQLFIPRAIEAFISHAKYMLGQSSSYLGLNHLSDLTEEELARIFLPPDDSEPADNDEAEADTASLEEMEKELVKPEVAAIAAQLEQPAQQQQRRKRRSTEGFLSGMASFVKYPFTSGGTTLKGGDDQMIFDLRDKKCWPAPKDQGSCNSCYIFSILSVFEYLHCVRTGKQVAFSEQYVLDCGSQLPSEVKTEGCSSSPPEHTWLFVQKFGLELGSQYPYKGSVHECPYQKSDASMGHTLVHTVAHVDLSDNNRKNRAKISELLRTKGPLVIGLKVGSRFTRYGGGVDKPRKTLGMANHAMTLVGEGIENGVEYWLIRNSLGADWGLGGYYKLAKDADPRVLVKLSYVESDFMENPKHDSEKLSLALQNQKGSKFSFSNVLHLR